MTKPVWIGLVEVRPRPRNDDLGDALAAYVHVLAPALTEEEFVAVTTAAMDDAGYDVVGIDRVDSFETGVGPPSSLDGSSKSPLR